MFLKVVRFEIKTFTRCHKTNWTFFLQKSESEGPFMFINSRFNTSNSVKRSIYWNSCFSKKNNSESNVFMKKKHRCFDPIPIWIKTFTKCQTLKLQQVGFWTWIFTTYKSLKQKISTMSGFQKWDQTPEITWFQKNVLKVDFRFFHSEI